MLNIILLLYFYYFVICFGFFLVWAFTTIYIFSFFVMSKHCIFHFLINKTFCSSLLSLKLLLPVLNEVYIYTIFFEHTILGFLVWHILQLIASDYFYDFPLCIQPFLFIFVSLLISVMIFFSDSKH